MTSVVAASQLESAGYAVAVKVFPNVGHAISIEEAQEACCSSTRVSIGESGPRMVLEQI